MAVKFDKSPQKGFVDEVFDCLNSSKEGMRAGALVEIAKMGPVGACSFGTADRVVVMLDDPSILVQQYALNAIGSMGRFGAPYAEQIMTKLSSSDSTVKRCAIRALGGIGAAAGAHAPAVESCLDDDNLDVVAEACYALGSMKATASQNRLADKVDSGDTEVAVAACAGLGAMEAEREVDAVKKALKSKEARLKAAALQALTQIDAESCLADAAKLLNDGDGYVRVAAAQLICSLGDKASGQVKTISKHLKDSNAGTRACAAAALGGIGEAASGEADKLADLIDDAEEDTSTLMMSTAGVEPKAAASLRKPCCAAAEALGAMGEDGQAHAAKVAEGLTSKDYEMRIASALSLARMGKAGVKFEDAVCNLLEDPLPLVVCAAADCLGELGGSSSAAEKLGELIDEKNHAAVRASALTALSKMSASAYIDEILKCIVDPIWSVRAAAVSAIGACGEDGQMFASDVCRLLEDESPEVRIAAVTSLGKMGERGAAFADEVMMKMSDPVPEVCIATLQYFDAVKAADYMPRALQFADYSEFEEVREAAQSLNSRLALEG